MDWNLPVIADTFANWLAYFKNRDTDLAKGLDPAKVAVANPGADFIRWTSAGNKWEIFNGVAWVDLAAAYAIAITGNAATATKWAAGRTIQLTGAVTGVSGAFDGSANLSFATALAANIVGDANLRVSNGVSVIGRAANSVGDPTDITAGADDRVLARTANALSFTQLTANMAPNGVWTYAKLQNVSATDRLLGRVSVGAGVIEEITCTATGRSVLAAASAAAARAAIDAAQNGVLNAPAGTRMIFHQTAAPTGWTKDITINDKALRIVSGAVGSGGASAFSSVFGAGKLTAAYTLAVADMPSHSHIIDLHIAVGGASPSMNADNINHNDIPTTAVGGSGGHAHGVNLDLQYVDVIVASKD